ncbi:Elongation of fatty acids protein 2 [Cyanidiococcus yangmingshanensis]|uniref:Flap endonuclease 1 n=1 Tax=Cyanidiococcus yangmingshanensis TaxID=2690220 RepID=A0A7J7ICN9_9RHOD|nr:Elongation of fatty acids protein 2 [Cyanidiococcus yangmingshanensis]
MGIRQLAKLIADHAPRAYREQDIKALFGRTVAIDASMSIYQFLVAVRTADAANLTNESGEITSHLSGIFYRTIRLLELGMKPIYVFDGKAPELKANELAKRRSRREEDEQAAAKAREEGDLESYAKYARRVNKVSAETIEKVKRLLHLMGIPVVEAPSEAEAQCAALTQAGIAYATASEDMDALTFGAPILIRNLFASLASGAERKDRKPSQFSLPVALSELGISMDQFIDICILCGCDYTCTIPKIGPYRALTLVKQHGRIEEVLEFLERSNYTIPEDFDYQGARELFKHPQTIDAAKIEPMLEWRSPDEEGLVQFLVQENSFNEALVHKAVERMTKALRSGVANQSRLDTFFKAKPMPKRPDSPRALKKSSKRARKA